jgi:SRSO17 transposase
MNFREAQLWYLAEVPHDTQVWRQCPDTGVPAWSGQGRKPTRRRVLTGAAAPQTVAQLAAALPAHGWARRTIKEGSKGPLVAHVAALRVIAVRESLPGPAVWLVLRRHVLTRELKTYLSNAPADIPLTTLVWVTGMRWPYG